jgi:hypothetical protein
LAGFGGGNPPNGTSSRDSGLSMDGENGFSGGYPGYSNGFPGFSGFPGFQNGFPGFQNGFPGSPGGFAGSMNGSLENGNQSSPAANSGFLSGGNLDFSKMAAMVSFYTRKKCSILIFPYRYIHQHWSFFCQK